jgi:beta-N-acetylhexosaminidase
VLLAASNQTPPQKNLQKKAATDSAAASALRALTLRDRIAQMIVVRGYGDYPAPDDEQYRRFGRWIREDHVGGFIVAGRIRNGNVLDANAFEMAAFINHVQRMAHTPLLVASDFERGAANRVGETASFPYMMAFGAAQDPALTKELGAVTAKEARALGVNWVFAPDADVNNNPDNPIINVRSFGEDPRLVAQNVAAFIDGAHSDIRHYVLVTAKHFPGHGDTAQDSHMQLARVDAPRERLESLEFVPFRAAIEHGVDSIMTAHLAVPAIEPAGLPATLSRNVLTNVLRDDMNFKGLVVTDAMEMQGITSLFPEGEAAVRAVEAGADVLLMPINPDTVIKAIEAAVESGRISRKRIDASVAKILSAKQKVGLYRSRLVDLDEIPAEIKAKQAADLAQRVADRSLTLLKDEKHLFPMPPGSGSCLVIMTERQFSSRGELLVYSLLRSQADVKTYFVNAGTPDSELSAAATDIAQCKQVYVAAFVTVAANRGSVALEGGLGTFLTDLVHASAPVALISLGNPYLWRQFPDVAAYLATFSTSDSSEIATARALAGKVGISGKAPISIPPLAKLGDGISVAMKQN